MTYPPIHHTISFSSAPASALRLLLSMSIRVCLAFYLALTWHNALAFEAPSFQGDLLDEAGILAESDRETLRERIRTLREGDDIWAAIYIRQSVQEVSVEEAAVLTFEKWQLGQKGKDNGVLVLLVPAERKVRIEVGYGLEGAITDALSRRIIAEIYAPTFREQRFVDGLLRGFDVMAKARQGAIALPEPPSEPAQQEINWDGAGTRFLLSLVINLLPVAIYAAALVHGRRHGRIGMAEGDDVRTPFFIFLFIGLVFGLFHAVFGAAFADDSDVTSSLIAGNVLFAGVFSIPYGLKVGRLLSNTAYLRHQARLSLSGTSDSQDRTRWESSRSSSSSSGSDSDSSSSSSSGGGSSGGGGASGSW